MEQSPVEVSVTVAELASDTLETRIKELRPLVNVINSDALNEIVPDYSSHYITVTVVYAALRVSVHSGNTVSVKPNHDEPIAHN